MSDKKNKWIWDRTRIKRNPAIVSIPTVCLPFLEFVLTLKSKR